MSIFGKRKYKFTDKKHSKGGIIASGLFLVSLVFMLIGIYVAFAKHGNASMTVGVLGISALITAIIGFVIGMRSFKDDEVFLLFPWIGTVGCAGVLICMGAIVLIGL